MKKAIFLILINTILSACFSQVDYIDWVGYKLKHKTVEPDFITIDNFYEQDTFVIYTNATLVIDSMLSVSVEPDLKFTFIKEYESNKKKIVKDNYNKLEYYEAIYLFLVNNGAISIMYEHYSSIKFEIKKIRADAEFKGERLSFNVPFVLVGSGKNIY